MIAAKAEEEKFDEDQPDVDESENFENALQENMGKFDVEDPLLVRRIHNGHRPPSAKIVIDHRIRITRHAQRNSSRRRRRRRRRSNCHGN